MAIQLKKAPVVLSERSQHYVSKLRPHQARTPNSKPFALNWNSKMIWRSNTSHDRFCRVVLILGFALRCLLLYEFTIR